MYNLLEKVIQQFLDLLEVIFALKKLDLIKL